jgi:hypothetical protein
MKTYYRLRDGDGSPTGYRDGSAVIPHAPGNARYQQMLGEIEAGDAAVEDFVAPTRMPSVVSMRQARLALNAAGLLSAVEGAIDAAGMEARIEWEFAATVERDSQLVQDIAAGLSLSESQLDDLFTSAGGF